MSLRRNLEYATLAAVIAAAVFGAWQAYETRSARIAERRAWVVTHRIEVQANAKPWGLKLFLKNTGQSPALALAVSTQTEVLPPNKTPAFSYFGIPVAPGGTLAPGGEIPQSQFPPAPLEQVQHGEVVVWFHGRIAYDDIFGDAHWTDFCYRTMAVYAGFDALVQLSPCEIHNGTDETSRSGSLKLSAMNNAADWINAGAAVVVALFTIVLWRVSRRQADIADKQADIAKAQGIASKRTARASLFVEGIEHHEGDWIVTVKNHGQTAALDVQVLVFGMGKPHAHGTPDARWVIPASTHIQPAFTVGFPLAREVKVEVRFEDVFGDRHLTTCIAMAKNNREFSTHSETPID